MRNYWKHFFIVFLIVLIAFGGYALMHLSVYVLPVSGNNTFSQVFYTLLVIALGLAVPYWMLKLSIHKAHLKNPHEKELTLSDIPKTQEAADRS